MLSRRSLGRSARTCFIYFGLAFYSQGVLGAIQAASGDVARKVAGETNLSSTLAQSLILAVLLAAVARDPRRYLRMAPPILPLLCIVSFAILSVLWSGDPVRTLRRGMALAECTLFGMFVFRAEGLDTAIRRIGQVCVAMAALSLLAYVAAPGIGRETAFGYEHAMRGVFSQKNSMAECMLLGICCFAYRMLGGAGWRQAGAVALLGLCIVLGRGASTLLIAGVVGVASLWLRCERQPVLRLAILFLAGWSVLALVVALAAFPQELFAVAGRDTSLTGRVPVWLAAWPEFLRAPVLGHGFAGFWRDDSPTVQMIWRYAGWQAQDAHSSYLDILLQLGLVGFGLYAWSWLALLGRARGAHRTGLASARFVILYGATLLLMGLDEGTIPVPNAWTAMFPVALLALGQHRALRLGAPVRSVAQPTPAMIANL